MTKPTFLDEAKAAVRRSEENLQRLQMEQTRAAGQVEELESRVRELGFDPDMAFENQVVDLERDLEELLDGIEKHLNAANDLLRPAGAS